MTAEKLILHQRSIGDLLTFTRQFEFVFPTAMTPEAAAEEVLLLNESIAGERHPNPNWRTVTTHELSAKQWQFQLVRKQALLGNRSRFIETYADEPSLPISRIEAVLHQNAAGNLVVTGKSQLHPFWLGCLLVGVLLLMMVLTRITNSAPAIVAISLVVPVVLLGVSWWDCQKLTQLIHAILEPRRTSVYE